MNPTARTLASLEKRRKFLVSAIVRYKKELATLEEGVRDMHIMCGGFDTPRLTEREKQVTLAVLEHLANKEIASVLHVTERTIKFHVSAVLAKYNVHNRNELIDAIRLREGGLHVASTTVQ